MKKAVCLLEVVFTTSNEIVFKGEAQSVILPGEQGTFEVCPFHKAIVSRLMPGIIRIDRKELAIKHGVVTVQNNSVTGIVEPVAPTRSSGLR